MSEEKKNGTGYTLWQKAILVSCLVVAIIGTLMIIGGIIRASKTVSEYGGKIGAPFVVVAILSLVSLWLFVCTAAVVIQISKTNREILSLLRSREESKIEGSGASSS